MQLATFNAAPADEAIAVARAWADVPAWAAALVAARPYDSVDELAAEAGLLSADWDAGDLDRALAHTPATADGPERHASADAAAIAIADAHAVYEERFGRAFLVRVAGRGPEQILAELRRRLGNDPETETDEALEQLAEIAVLRLRAAIADGVDG